MRETGDDVVIASARERLSDVSRIRGPGRDTRSGRSLRILAVIVVGLGGGLIGILLGGRVETPVGPVNVAMSVHPSWNGGTTVDVPPLGTLRMDSHWGPLRLRAQVAEIRSDDARQLIEDPAAIDGLTETIGGEVRHGVIVLAVRALAFALVFGALAGLLVFRSWRVALVTATTALVGFAMVGGLAVVTFNPQSVVEPRYTGLLTSAPQVVGDARSIARRFSEYRGQLARLVGNVSRLYAATSTLPTYEPDPTTIRVLHVSDIHLNPVAWSVIGSISKQFQVQMIIDTGDLTDHGSKPEEKFLDEIEKLKLPYVFIRGNHDSRATERAVGKQKNAVVLDGQMKDIGGLRVYGAGDSRFTPDKSTRDDNVGAAAMTAEGQRLAQGLRGTGLRPDIALLHDPSVGQAFDGATPLVLSGHTHQRSTKLLPSGTRLFVQGSTGGAGLRGLEGEQPTPIELSILYFDRTTHRLQGWDDFRLGGLGQTSAQIERKLEPQPDRQIKPPVPQSPSVTPGSPSGTPGSPSETPGSPAGTPEPEPSAPRALPVAPAPALLLPIPWVVARRRG
ncbi:metallophosphoesterase family protein [Actinomadura alba]|uniref:metallophosphoesterase family protein n=1 Tax=Actinomadura alba TaxID=406431 RepID=UPI0028B19A95|nr:metallophosphoesterase [Actinomadura alba]